MKRKWKQILATLLIFVLLLAVPGCTSGDHKDTEVSAAEGFVLLSDIAPDVIQEIRYYSTYNFVGERIDGYEEPCALMTKEAAAALNEVSKDVIDRFKDGYARKYWPELFYEKSNGKYQLNLWKANEILLCEAGIPKDQISVTDLCTCCNPRLLYSHRASQGRRGNLAAFLMIR